MSSVRLTAQLVEQTATSLVLAYAVQNTGHDEVFVCNRLYRERTPDGLFVVDPDVVYVLFEPGPVPNVTKRILDRGEDVMVEQPVQPCATLLTAGASFEERLALSLPLGPIDPYHRFAPRDPADAEPSRGLAISIGWVAAADVDDILVPAVETTVGRLPVIKASPQVQTIERVDLEASVPVLPPGIGLVVQRECSTCGAVNLGPQAACLQCHAPLPPPAAPAGASWQPTHRVPEGGMPAYAEPGAAASMTLDAGLPVQLVERAGDWARVVAWTGWTGWVDGRALVPLSPGA